MPRETLSAPTTLPVFSTSGASRTSTTRASPLAISCRASAGVIRGTTAFAASIICLSVVGMPRSVGCGPAFALASALVQDAQRRLMDAPVAGHHDAATGLRGPVFPRADDAARAGDDGDHGNDIVGLYLGFDNEVDQPRRQHAVGVAVPAVARELHPALQLAKARAVGVLHQQRARGAQDRLVERRARAHVQIAFAAGAPIGRGHAVAGKTFAGERLMHHAENRLAEAHRPMSVPHATMPVMKDFVP